MTIQGLKVLDLPETEDPSLWRLVPLLDKVFAVHPEIDGPVTLSEQPAMVPGEAAHRDSDQEFC